MYSTCIFCHSALGDNQVIEHFPVGKRLAFDEAKGRLWVVCDRCRQWNLSPLEERWEAIEEAERLFRATRLRVSTEQIGLARAPDGTELIRIGAPQRPEMAAWRYGPRFEARRRKSILLWTAGSVAAVGYVAADLTVGLALGGLPPSLFSLVAGYLSAARVVGRLGDADGPIVVTWRNLADARLVSSPGIGRGWQLQLPHFREDLRVGQLVPRAKIPATGQSPTVTLRDEEALQAARVILPHLNASGGRRGAVAEATAALSDAGSPDAMLARGSQLTSVMWTKQSSNLIREMPVSIRLAMEMAAHEEVERRALEGELAALEASWKAAEEIAAIADSLTLPERVATRFAQISAKV